MRVLFDGKCPPEPSPDRNQLSGRWRSMSSRLAGTLPAIRNTLGSRALRRAVHRFPGTLAARTKVGSIIRSYAEQPAFWSILDLVRRFNPRRRSTRV
jgi:hypothetical protein